jgi:putative PIN family toxin of toxin-antitoxin system
MQAVVIDTNVIISAALSAKSHPFQIMELVSAGFLQLYYSTDILAEYVDVLSRKKFNFSPEKQTAFTNKVKEIGVLTNAPSSDLPFTDESDRIFYDVARSCDALLITGNKRHYPSESFVVTPAEFVGMFG